MLSDVQAFVPSSAINSCKSRSCPQLLGTDLQANELVQAKFVTFARGYCVHASALGEAQWSPQHVKVVT